MAFSNFIIAEGTKQLRPASGDFGYLQINDKGRTFATYIANEDERLYIHISNRKEKIYFGFGNIKNGTTNVTDVWYRIKNQSGNIVYGPFKVTNTGKGYISSYSRAIAGPNILNSSGYSALEYTPIDTGDYYIEFNQGHATNISNPNNNKRVFENFDITVIDTVIMQARNGRVWSKNWDITTDGGTNGFKATFYVYSNDGVVTSVNFNGMQPHAFRLACNSTGCTNTGNPLEDRKSRLGNYTYSSYKIFLNDPDINVYPNGIIGTLKASLSLTGCAPNYCLNVTTDAAGYMEFLVDLNGVSGYQKNSADVVFGQNVEKGTTCIPWNGKDGLGNQINQSINFEVLAEYKFGLTNLPLFDVENFNAGLIVSSIRPSVIKPKLFWDDTDISGGASNLIGCTSTACHAWPSRNFGDERTINTWWYVNVQKDTIITQDISRPAPSILGKNILCDIDTNRIFSTNLIPGNNYLWRIKKGAILGSNSNHTVEIKPVYGIDTLTVLESNILSCFEDSIFIYNYPVPSAIFTGDSLVCGTGTINIYNVSNVILGNTYEWTVFGGVLESGQGTSSINVKWNSIGTNFIELKELNKNGCNKNYRKNIHVYQKPIISNIVH